VVLNTRVRVVFACSLLSTLLLLSLPAAVQASSLSAKKAQARAAASQVTALDQRLDQMVGAYAGAVQHLQALQAQAGANRAALRLDQYQLRLSRQQLADHLVLAYKDGNAGVLNAVFQSGSFDDLLAKLDYVQHLTGSDAGLVQAVQLHQRRVLAEHAALQTALTAAQQTTAQLSTQRAQLDAQLGERRSVLRGLNAAVGRLVVQTKAVTPVASSARSAGTPPSTAGDGAGPWWPQIKSAAGANGIWAEGLYRLMLAESGGSAAASNGVDMGLFQYSAATWKGAWNPWHAASIFDGGAQIKATALAIHLGSGPSWWPTTYAWAFSRQ
jgi:hypothetical protein